VTEFVNENTEAQREECDGDIEDVE
jgi:hypothetical protein